MNTKTYTAQQAADAMQKARADYDSPKGIARYWQKDGAWHVALPCPEIVDGLRTGGFRYTDDCYDTREEAIAAIG